MVMSRQELCDLRLVTIDSDVWGVFRAALARGAIQLLFVFFNCLWNCPKTDKSQYSLSTIIHKNLFFFLANVCNSTNSYQTVYKDYFT